MQGTGLDMTDEKGLICCSALGSAGASRPTSQPNYQTHSPPGGTRASGAGARRQPQASNALGTSPRWCLVDGEYDISVESDSPCNGCVTVESGSPLSPWARKAPPSAERRSLPFSADDGGQIPRAHATALNQLSPRATRDVKAERAVLLL